MRCKAITKARGTRCKHHALHDDPSYCIYHSKSPTATKWRHLPRKKHRIGRDELLKKLSKDLRDLDKAKFSLSEKIKLRAALSSKIMELLNQVEKIDELELRVKELEANGKI